MLLGNDFKLYDLIGRRTVAAQIADAKGSTATVTISAVSYTHLDVYKRQAFSVVLHARGEVVLHQVGEVLLEQAHDAEGDPVGYGRLAAGRDVAAIDDRGDDARVGGGAPDAGLLELLDDCLLYTSRCV